MGRGIRLQKGSFNLSSQIQLVPLIAQVIAAITFPFQVNKTNAFFVVKKLEITISYMMKTCPVVEMLIITGDSFLVR